MTISLAPARRRFLSREAKTGCAAAGSVEIEAFIDNSKADGHEIKLHLEDDFKLDVDEPSDLAMFDGHLFTVSDRHSKVYRLSSDGDFVLDILRKLGEDRLDELVTRANVTDKAALQAFRDRAQRNKGILPTLEIGLGGVAEKLSRDRTGLTSEFEKLKIGTTGPDTSTLVPGVLLPTGPMMTMSNSMGCTGAYLAIGGGAGLMVGGIILEDSAMFGFGAVALGIGIGAAAYFC